MTIGEKNEGIDAHWIGFILIMILMFNILPDVWITSYGHNYGSPNNIFAFPLWCIGELILIILAYRNYIKWID